MRQGVLKLIVSALFAAVLVACGEIAITPVDHSCPVNARSGDSGCGAY
jgi:hypothetical protein